MGKTFEKKKVVKNNQSRLSNYDRRLFVSIFYHLD